MNKITYNTPLVKIRQVDPTVVPDVLGHVDAHVGGRFDGADRRLVRVAGEQSDADRYVVRHT